MTEHLAPVRKHPTRRALGNNIPPFAQQGEASPGPRLWSLTVGKALAWVATKPAAPHWPVVRLRIRRQVLRSSANAGHFGCVFGQAHSKHTANGPATDSASQDAVMQMCPQALALTQLKCLRQPLDHFIRQMLHSTSQEQARLCTALQVLSLHTHQPCNTASGQTTECQRHTHYRSCASIKCPRLPPLQRFTGLLPNSPC